MPMPYQAPYPQIAAPLQGQDGHPYIAHDDLLAAANAALALQRPLLLTGEAGCGKTDFAFAAARALAHHPLADEHTGAALDCYVRSDTRARDLLYRFDALVRFGDAQGGESGRLRVGDPRHYLTLEPLGRAFITSALRVVLVDEIDKAPRDLPNDLLRELNHGEFEIPEIPRDLVAMGKEVDPDRPLTFRRLMRRPAGARKPFLVITSNVERQLPDPFLRRCVFYQIRFPGNKTLQTILRTRFPGAPLTLLAHAVTIMELLRLVSGLTKKPTTSELIDWVDVMLSVFDRGGCQQVLGEFVAEHERDRNGLAADLPWARLPALGCLVKLREDLEERLGVKEEPARA